MTAASTPREDDLVKVIIRMPAWLHEAIKERAEAEERSMATCIRRAIRAYLGQGA